MRRYIEYGALSAAILTLIYLIIAFITEISINLQSIGICVGGGIVTGIFIAIALIHLSPGEAILEGEEDNYINNGN